MNLVIVESPAKAKTIEKYLGNRFKVLASFGHVRDLPEKKLGVNTRGNFEPEYVIPPKSRKTVSQIKSAAKSAKDLYLATDLDREGEAISWHLLKAIDIKEDDPKVKRIVFAEITKNALERAIKKPRGIDMDLVDAQQARRVLDRLVGYKLSPLLWRKVRSGLSAGRVQTVAVRLVVEREREIKNFKPEEYWVVAVLLSKVKDDLKFKAFLIEKNGQPIKKMDIKNQREASGIKKALENANYSVLSVDKSDISRRPSAPFTTSTLQMEASRKLGFSAKQTMMLAQKLYENGHITYMRTDSTNLSGEAVKAIRSVIIKKYGSKYLPSGEQRYQTQTKRAQEAHEAVRPTDFSADQASSDRREQNLYEMIWKRSVASQMKEAVIGVIEAKIAANTRDKHIFLARGESVKFDGFIKVYTEGTDEEGMEEQVIIPELVNNEKLEFHNLETTQKFTEPPKRYTEATLVKKLEGLGIGRPSTYAPTMSTIVDRGYVILEDKRFKPEEIGEIVNDLLVKHFPDIFDYKFTAQMEDELDAIAAGEMEWPKVIEEFYVPFSKHLSKKDDQLDKKKILKSDQVTEHCPECRKKLVIKFGKFGKFLACSGYPDCKFSKPFKTKEDKKASILNKNGETEALKEVEGEKCEKCKGKMVLKEGRFGKFLACENYPKCKNTRTIVITTKVKCPDCGEGELVERRTKKGRTFWGCSTYPKCKYATWEQPKKE